MAAGLRKTALLLALTLLAGCKVIPDPAPTGGATPSEAPPPAEAPPRPVDARRESAPSADSNASGPAQAEPAAAAALPTPTLPAPAPASGPATGVPVAAPPADVPATPPAPTAAEHVTHVQANVDRVRAWLAGAGLAGVLLTQPENVAWLTGGLALPAPPGTPAPSLAVLPDRVLVVAASDVLPAALAAVQGLGISGRTYRWDLGRDPAAPAIALKALVGDGALASDTHRPGTSFAADAVSELRRPLSELEQARLRWLGAAAATAVAETAGRAAASDTEAALQQRLAEALRKAGLEPADVRVTALERLPETGLAPGGPATLASGAAVHVTARRWGLAVTLGRTVTPQASSAATDAFVRARRLYAAQLAAIQPGALLRDVFARAGKAAAALGAAKLYERRPPGGAGAWLPLEQPFAPDSVERLDPRQAATLLVPLDDAHLADTLLVLPDRVEVVTATAAWPSPALPVNGRLVPVPTLRGAEEAVDQLERSRGLTQARRQAMSWVDRVVGGAITRALEAAPPPAETKAPAEATKTPAEAPAEAPATVPAEAPEPAAKVPAPAVPAPPPAAKAPAPAETPKAAPR